MLITPASSPLLLAGQQILTDGTGTFTDDFQRGGTLQHAPLGMGWTDLAELYPQAYDLTRIHNGSAQSGDPYSRGKNGATMAPDDDWYNYRNYPGMAVGGIGGAIRNVGDGIYNYDVTCRISGLLSGATELGPESEGTPLVGANPASSGMAYGAWLVNLRGDFGFDLFCFLIGTVGNPVEAFNVTHTSGPITHTHGQERELTLKYRGTTMTVWLDGVQVTNFSEYPGGLATGGTIPISADYQNKSWAGFEFDQHITPPADIATTPSILHYSHQVIS